MNEKRKDNRKPGMRVLPGPAELKVAEDAGSSNAAAEALALAVMSARKLADGLPAEPPPAEATAETTTEAGGEKATPASTAAASTEAPSGKAAAPVVDVPSITPPASVAEPPPSKASEAMPAAPRAEVAAPAASDRGRWVGYGAQAAVLALAVALGWLGGSLAARSSDPAQTVAPAWAEATASGIRQNQDDVLRLASEVKAMQASLDAIATSLDGRKTESSAKPVLDRFDRAERSAKETSVMMARMGEQLDRLEHASRDLAKAGGAERLDRIERQVTAAAAAPKASAPAPAPEPSQTGSLSGAKSDPRQTPLEGWTLREVYDGMALVEGRNNRLHEVAPGGTLPGVGRVDAIERRGKVWVVVTEKGVIGTGRW